MAELRNISYIKKKIEVEVVPGVHFGTLIWPKKKRCGRDAAKVLNPSKICSKLVLRTLLVILLHSVRSYGVRASRK